jgi:hypothetical protein
MTIPQTPALLLSLVLATVYATLFSLWQARGLVDLLVYWLAALLGFAAGYVVGLVWNPAPLMIGQVHIVESTIGAILFLFAAKWLKHGLGNP